MIYVWFTGINYYKLAVEKDRDSIVTQAIDIREGVLMYVVRFNGIMATIFHRSVVLT
jgi:hypothetical protein